MISFACKRELALIVSVVDINAERKVEVCSLGEPVQTVSVLGSGWPMTRITRV